MPACEVISIVSSEPDDNGGDGATTGDSEIIGGLNIALRAERSGKGPGRVYTIEVECSDASGNSTTDTTEVSVSHDKRK